MLIKPINFLRKLYWFVFRPKTFGVKCIVVSGNEILMIRNAYGHKLWTFPGGGIDNNETPEQAVRREVKEETGVDVKNLRKIGQFQSLLEYKDDTVQVFVAETDSKDIRIDPREIMEARWFDIDGLPIISEYAKKIVSMWMRKEI